MMGKKGYCIERDRAGKRRVGSSLQIRRALCLILAQAVMLSSEGLTAMGAASVSSSAAVAEGAVLLSGGNLAEAGLKEDTGENLTGTDGEENLVENLAESGGEEYFGATRSFPETILDARESEPPSEWEGSSSLSNLYTLQTGREAPAYDWREHQGENALGEAGEVMNAMGAGEVGARGRLGEDGASDGIVAGNPGREEGKEQGAATAPSTMDQGASETPVEMDSALGIGAGDGELLALGAADYAIREVTYGRTPAVNTFDGNGSGEAVVKTGIDLRGAVLLKINTAVRCGARYGSEAWTYVTVFNAGNSVSHYNFPTARRHNDMDSEQVIHNTEWFWNNGGFSDSNVGIKLKIDSDSQWDSFWVESIVIGYPRYIFKIVPDYNGMGEYREKIYTRYEAGGNRSEDGETVKYPQPYFTDGGGKHVSELSFDLGQTVSPALWEGGGTNSKGVAADSRTLDFKGFKLLKSEKLSGDLLPASFKFDESFKTKYKDYDNGGTFELVPVYEPKSETVEFYNGEAQVGGKADVKGVFDGFPSGYQLKATMLDTIRVAARANPSYTVSRMILRRPTGGSPGKWSGWTTVQTTEKAADKATLEGRIDHVAGSYRYCRVEIGYDSAVAPSIAVRPSPKSVTQGTNCFFLYTDGPNAKDHPNYHVDMEAGSSLEIDPAIIREPYTFSAIPDDGYHTYWGDGTLDSDGDGQDDMKIPGYQPFRTTIGDQFMYIPQLPLHGKVYYNFVHDAAVPETIEPLSLSGFLQVADKLLLSGREVKRGLNGVKVFSNGQSTETKRGTYFRKVAKADGYYELEGTEDSPFYDLYSYNVTFTGDSGQGQIAAMLSQNPNALGEMILDAPGEVEVSDVKLSVKKDGSYAAVDTSATTDGYYLMDGGDHDFRLEMSARRGDENITQGVMTFLNKNGTKVNITGTNGTHSSRFTFDFDPKKNGILAGATALVSFRTGDRSLLSRDVGIKVADGVGTILIANSLSAAGSGTLRAKGADALAEGRADGLAGLLGSVGQAFDLGWSGSFDTAAGGDVYQDGADRVVRVGFGKEILRAGGEKDALMAEAKKAAMADEEAGQAAARVADLKARIQADASLREELARAREALAQKQTAADRARRILAGKLAGIQEPQKKTAAFGNGLLMDLGYSLLTSFGYESASGKWYFKDMLLTSALEAESSGTVRYETPVGVTVGVGTRLAAESGATFVAQETDAGERIYLTEDNKDSFDILAAAKNSGSVESHGLLAASPAINLTGSGSVAGGLVRVDVAGRAEYDMAYGTASEGAGAGAMSASLKVSALNRSARSALSNGTFALGEEGSADGALGALGAAGDSYLYEDIGALQPEDVGYMEGEAGWHGAEEPTEEGGLGALSSIDQDGIEAYSEWALASKIGPQADFHMASLGNGRFAAVFLNVPQDRIRDKDNAEAAYYTFYENGTWSEPVLLEEDGTLDQYPRICSLGSRGALLLWSSVNKGYKDTADPILRQNALDLHGRFVDSQGKLSEGVEEITRTTGDAAGAAMGMDLGDFAADRAFGAVVRGDRLVVGYEKRQYEAGQAAASVGDMLYPKSSLMAARSYDLAAGKWAEGGETLESLPGLTSLGAEAAEERVAAYNASVYGQRFFDYLPGVMLVEDLGGAAGYYREGGAGTRAVALENPEGGMLLESDAASCAIGGRDVGVFAYAVDTDGDLRTLGDRELYLATYDFDRDAFSEPIILTGQIVNGETGETLRPENIAPRLVQADSGLYLLWLSEGDILGMDVSHLLEHEASLVKTGELDGVTYRYVDKTAYAAEVEVCYRAPRILVEARRTKGAGEGAGGCIQSFGAETDGKHIYILWTQEAEHRPQALEDGLSDVQMWGARAEATAGGLRAVSQPVQITSHYGEKYDDVAFGIADGELVGVAREVSSRLITASEARAVFEDYDEATFVPYGIWDDTGAAPVAFRVRLAGAARVVDAGFVEAAAGGEGHFSLEVRNDGFEDLEGVTVTAVDQDGNGVLLDLASGEETAGPRLAREVSLEALGGGESYPLNGVVSLPAEARSAEVAITVAAPEEDPQTLTLREDLVPDVTVAEMTVGATGTRNLCQIMGTVRNDGGARAEAGSIDLIARTPGGDRKVASLSYPALLPGESYGIDHTVEVADGDFTEVEASVQASDAGEDGPLVEELCLYARYAGRLGELELPLYRPEYHHDADTDYGFLRRSANAGELDRMGHVTGVRVEAVKGVYDESGALSGGEVVSSGTGRIVLEAGETVDLQTEILTDLPVRTDLPDGGDGTGTENLSSRYEYIGDTAERDSDGMLHALREGSGRIRIYVYPGGAGYRAAEASVRSSVSGGDVRIPCAEDAFDALASKAVRSYVLDVDILAQGKRAEEIRFTAGGLRYRTIGAAEAAVCGFDSEAPDKIRASVQKKLTVPATVKYEGVKYKVTRIDAGAFRGSAALQRITLGKNVQTVGDYAFAGCGALVNLSLGSGVRRIGEGAFQGCGKLKAVTLPAKLEEIGASAFRGCAILKSVALPAKLEILGERAFYGCSALKTVTIRSEKLRAGLGADAFAGISPEAVFKLTMKDAAVRDAVNRALVGVSETFADKKGILYRIGSGAERTLTVMGLTDAAAKKLTSVAIPASVSWKGYAYQVTAIGEGAFQGNGRLTGVTLPKTVETIGDRAFAGASALKSAVIPAAVKTIGAEAYSGCGKLTSATISAPGLTVGEGAFDGVPDTARFKYPSMSKVEKWELATRVIGTDDSFVAKDGLKYEMLGSGLNVALLKGTTKERLTTLTVPDTVEYRGLELATLSIQDGAFAYRTELKKVVVGRNVFEICPDAFAGCKSLTSLTLKEGVVNIWFGAFKGCTGLRSVTIPGTVKVIGNSAFQGCAELKTVTIRSAELREVGVDAFGGIHPDAVFKLSVKADKKEAVRKLLKEAGIDA